MASERASDDDRELRRIKPPVLFNFLVLVVRTVVVEGSRGSVSNFGDPLI